jgi:hypothetical protein
MTKAGMKIMDKSVYKDKIIEIINSIDDENVLEYLLVFIKGKVKAEA